MDSDISFRFYEELSDFLPPARRRRDFSIRWRAQNSVKDMIESAGVPHTEVDLILVNGVSVGFSYLVRPGDRISVYPVFESFDISSLNRLRPEPLRVTRFVLDTHLGRLARYLRLLGFDSLYSNDYDDAGLAVIAAGEAGGPRRILLTRDHGLLKRKQVSHGYFVRSDDPRRQLDEVLSRFHLHNAVQPFRRCTRCNGLIRPAAKDTVVDRLPPRVERDFEEFSRCADCGKVYWRGSHYEHMQKIIGELLQCRTAGKQAG